MKSAMYLVVLLLAGELLSYGWRLDEAGPSADLATWTEARNPLALSLGLAVTLFVLLRLTRTTSAPKLILPSKTSEITHVHDHSSDRKTA